MGTPEWPGKGAFISERYGMVSVQEITDPDSLSPPRGSTKEVRKAEVCAGVDMLIGIPSIVLMFSNQIALQSVRMRYSFPAHSHTQTFSLIPLSPLWVCYLHLFSADLTDNTVNHSRLVCRERTLELPSHLRPRLDGGYARNGTRAAPLQCTLHSVCCIYCIL